MKQILIIVVVACSMNAYGQKETREVKTVSQVNKPAASLPVPVNPLTPVDFNTVEKCDQMIAALERRMAFVKADETRNAEAEKNGWYTAMKTEIQRYILMKEELKKNLK